MPVEKKLLEIMACPKCKEDIEEQGMFITCSSCKLAYPVKENVPDMLIEDVWDLEKAKKTGFRHSLKL